MLCMRQKQFQFLNWIKEKNPNHRRGGGCLTWEHKDAYIELFYWCDLRNTLQILLIQLSPILEAVLHARVDGSSELY